MTQDTEPLWIIEEETLLFHEKIIEKTGGSHGMRDQRLLQSALARSKNLYFYEEQTDIFELAASYTEGIAQNHAFVDGNKRTALAVSGLFLERNGYALEVQKEYEQKNLIEDITQGNISREYVVEFYRHNTQKIAQEQNR